VEYLDRIIPNGFFAVQRIDKSLKETGKFYVSHRVKSVEKKMSRGCSGWAENAKGETITLGNYSLVSVGRRPYTDGGLNADKAGVKNQ
jgi:dihydrolipoamide dehydrogenase